MVKSRANGTQRMQRRDRKRYQNIPMEPSLRQLSTYRIRRTVNAGTLIPGAVDQGAAYYVTPSTLPAWADFSTLYDMYRINSVTYKYVVTRTTASGTSGQVFPVFLAAVDYNDTVAPSTAQEVLDYGNAHVHPTAEGDSRTYEITYAPKAQQALNSGTGVTTANSLWARTSITSDTWLGHKMWVVNFNTTYPQTVIQWYITVDMEFKVTK